MAAISSSNTTITTAAVVGGAVVLAGVLGTLYARSSSSKKSVAIASPASSTVSSVAVPRPMPRSLSKENLLIHRQRALVVVDPISTGANLCHEIMLRKIPCIRVFSAHVPAALANMVSPGLLHDYAATIYDDDADFGRTIATLNELPYTIQAIIAGSELAIELADKLSEKMGVRSNGSETSFFRRDKFQMGEAVRRSRTRAVKQARVQNWLQVENFLALHDPKPFKVVIKPIRSAGSDRVSLCESRDELKQCLGEIVGTVNKMGMSNYAAVVQEYLEGNEYVVDTVSRDGVHTLASLWVYDKRPANGAKFVYFGMKVVDPYSEVGQAVFNYQKGVLDALGIQHGPGHGEVIVTNTGPVLVECGARPHGAEGTFIPLARDCFGRDQVSMTVDCYIDKKAFDEYKELPRLRKFAFKIDLVCYVKGILESMPHMEEVQRMASFQRFDMLPDINTEVTQTIDCFTAVGSISLCHADEAQVEADHQAIRALEPTFFKVRAATVSDEESKRPAKLTA